MDKLEITLFGLFEASLRGAPLRMPTRHTKLILALLALDLDKAVSRATLAATVWPDQPEAQARASLRQAIFRLRSAMGPEGAEALEVTPGWLKLRRDRVTLDLDSLEVGDGSALQGLPLDGLSGFDAEVDDRLETARAELRARLMRWLESSEAEAEAERRFNDLEALSRRHLALDPYDEPTLRLLMTALHRQGRRNAALDAFREAAERIRTDLGVAVEPATTALWQEIRRQAPAEPVQVAPVPAMPAPATPLPAAPALLERDEVLSRIAAARDAAAAGQGRSVVLAGEAGIGKTSVLHAALAQAEAEGRWRILRGACEDLAVAEPFGALRDAAGLIDAVEPEPGIEGMARLLARLSGEPTILAIEDLHWADDATLAFLRFAARRIAGYPVLVMVSARTDGAWGRSRLRAALDGVPPGDVVRLDLAPLSEAAISALAEGSPRDVAEVATLTDGNPLFVTELLQSGSSVPVSIQDAVLARADRLEPEARRLVDLVSVFARPPDSLLLDDLLSDIDLDAALAGATAEGLLSDTERGVAFPHELTRRAVQGALGASVRRRWHHRVFGALDRRPDTPAAILLHHAQGAGNREAIARLAPDAGREAERLGARRQAADFYEMAVTEADAPDPVLLAQSAWLHYLVGRASLAVARQRAAIELWHAAGDRQREGDAERHLSRYLWSYGDLAAAREALDRALDLLRDSPGPELAMALASQAQLALLDLDFDGAARAAEPAKTLARSLGEGRILSHTLNTYGMSQMLTDPARAHALLDESIALAAAAGEPDHVARGRLNKGAMCEYQLDMPGMERLMGEAVDYARAQELDGYARYCEGLRGLALMKMGRWDEAETLCRQLIDGAGGATMETNLFPAHIVSATLALRRGRPHAEDLAALHEFTLRVDEMQRMLDVAVLEAEGAFLGVIPRDVALAKLAEVLARVANPANVQMAVLWRHRLCPGEAEPHPGFAPPVALELAGRASEAAAAWEALSMPFEAALALLAAGETEAGLSRCAAMGATAYEWYTPRMR